MAGEIGCYHSHLNVWQAFLNTDASTALILEDDVIFHEEFCDAVNAALKVLDDWDVLKLNDIRAKFPITEIRIREWQCRAYVGAFTGTGAYLINRRVAQQLLDSFLPILRPIGHELDRSHHQKLRHFGLTPYPSHLADGGESTTTDLATLVLQTSPDISVLESRRTGYKIFQESSLIRFAKSQIKRSQVPELFCSA